MVATTTRKKAVETALALFNAEATASVSMNRVAAACGISRSNLEYYFPSKRDLIAAVYGSIVAEMDRSWYQDHLHPTRAHMAMMYARHSLLVYRYRFFYRELPKLLRDDAQLRFNYHENRCRRFAAVETFFNEVERLNVLSFAHDARLLRSLLESTWVLSENWLQTTPGPDAPVHAVTVFQSYRLILDILQPYTPADQAMVTDESWQAIAAHLADSEGPAAGTPA